MSVPSSNDPLSIHSVQSFKNADTGQIQTKAEGTLKGHSFTVIFDSPLKEKMNGAQIKELLEMSRINFMKDSIEYSPERPSRTFVKYQDFNIEIQHGKELKETFKNVQDSGRELSSIGKNDENKPSFLTRVYNVIRNIFPQNWFVTEKDVERHSPPATPHQENVQLAKEKERVPLAKEKERVPVGEQKELKPRTELPVENLQSSTPDLMPNLKSSTPDLMPRPRIEKDLPATLKPILDKIKENESTQLKSVQFSKIEDITKTLELIRTELSKASSADQKEAIKALYDRYKSQPDIAKFIDSQVQNKNYLPADKKPLLALQKASADLNTYIKTMDITNEDLIKALVDFSGNSEKNKIINESDPQFKANFQRFHKWIMSTEDLLKGLNNLYTSPQATDEDKKNIQDKMELLLENRLGRKITPAEMLEVMKDKDGITNILKQSKNTSQAINIPNMPVKQVISEHEFFSNIAKASPKEREQRAAQLASDLNILFRNYKGTINSDLNSESFVDVKKPPANTKQFVDFYNKVSSFTVNAVLKKDKAEREALIDFFITVRDAAVASRDFETAYAITSALTSAAIGRLIDENSKFDLAKRLDHPLLKITKNQQVIRDLVGKNKEQLQVELLIKDLTLLTTAGSKGLELLSMLTKIIPNYPEPNFETPLEFSFTNEINSLPTLKEAEKEYYERSLAIKPRAPAGPKKS